MKKKLLILGKSSYIGRHFGEWLRRWPDRYECEWISVRDKNWRGQDFSQYDAVLHLAGITQSKGVFQSKKKFDAVNRDLAVQAALKAKNSGVRQFIFLSSMSVYGVKQGMITKDTPIRPKSHYGRSKWEAEQALWPLAGGGFTVSVLRAPMVYGKNCPGNFQILKKIAVKAPFFPSVENSRSMIYIDNLCECLRLVWEERRSGLIFPQNKAYVSTRDMVARIARESGHKIAFVPFFNGMIRWMTGRQSTVTKVFGALTYDMDLSRDSDRYTVQDYMASVRDSCP
jgi:UDP-glucose 4-epimerase